MGHFKWVPAIWAWLIGHFLFIFLCSNNKKIYLFLIFVIQFLKIFRYIETLIVSNCSSRIKLVLKMRVIGVILAWILFMIDSSKLVFQSHFFFMVVLLVYYHLHFNSLLKRVISECQYWNPVTKRVFFLLVPTLTIQRNFNLSW